MTVGHRGRLFGVMSVRLFRLYRGDFSARSPRGQVFFGVRVRLFSFLLQGISRLTLEMTSCPIRGEAVGRAGLPRPRITCAFVSVSTAGDFSTSATPTLEMTLCPIVLYCHFDRSEDDSPNAAEKSPAIEVNCSCTTRPSSLPGDCHVADACPARSIAISPLWLKTVT